MTDDMMNLRALLEKSSDAELLRDMVGFACATGAVQRSRYMSLETIAPVSDDPIVRLSAVPA